MLSFYSCSWYSTAREISGISGIYFWSKLCAELSEHRWQKLHCPVNSSTLVRVSPGKARADGAYAWAAPPAWHARHAELWGWISLPRCSMEGRAAYGVPRPHLPCRARITQPCAPQVPLPTSLNREGAVVLLSGRSGWSGWPWLQRICSFPPLSSA